MKKGFIIVYFLAVIFGAILVIDLYRPNCAGAGCLYIPTIVHTERCTNGNNYQSGVNVTGGSNTSNLICDYHHTSLSIIENDIGFLTRFHMSKVGEYNDGGGCLMHFVNLGSPNLYGYSLDAWRDANHVNDIIECQALQIDWDNFPNDVYTP